MAALSDSSYEADSESERPNQIRQIRIHCRAFTDIINEDDLRDTHAGTSWIVQSVNGMRLSIRGDIRLNPQACLFAWRSGAVWLIDCFCPVDLARPRTFAAPNTAFRHLMHNCQGQAPFIIRQL